MFVVLAARVATLFVVVLLLAQKCGDLHIILLARAGFLRLAA
jgi:hypothetical protein